MEVDRPAREGRFDYLLIESSGISEPMPVTATFAFARDDGAALADLARLDTMVTVVDAANFLPELASGDELVERGPDQYQDDERTASDPLMDRIEFADVIVLNKLGLVDQETASRLRATLTRLNPAARVVPAVHGSARVADVLGTRLFDLERAQQAPGWVKELNGDHVPETEDYGISSTVFRSELPFHPARLWTFVTGELDSGPYGQILRSKGFFTLVGRPHAPGPVRARRRMVGVREHAAVQGRPVRAHLLPDRPLRAHEPSVLRMRRPGRPEAPAHPGMDVWGMQGRPGPGRQPRRSTSQRRPDWPRQPVERR